MGEKCVVMNFMKTPYHGILHQTVSLFNKMAAMLVSRR